MILQIFTSDLGALNTPRVPMIFMNLHKRGFNINCDLTPLRNFIPSTDLEECFINVVRSTVGYGYKDYKLVFEGNNELKVDMHHECEKLGLDRNARENIIIISLEDSLDYILHYLCGADIYKVRGIKNYKAISKSLLSAYYNPAGLSCTLDQFWGVDDKLDGMLDSLAKEHNGDALAIAQAFHTNLLKTAHLLIKIISLVFKDIRGRNTIFTSIGLASSVFTSDVPFEEDIVLTNTDEEIEDYTIRVGCFKRYEFLDNLAFEWSK